MASVQATKIVTMDHLEHAKDEMILGTLRKSAIITEKDRKLTAYHEGGHAVVALYTPHSMPIHKATIMPRGQSLGMVAQLPENDQLSMSQVELLAKLDVCMGGRVAEELIYGREMVTTGASSDFANATAIARSMVTKYGMSDVIGPLTVQSDEEYDRLSADTKMLIDQEIQRLFEASKKRVRALLQGHMSQLHILANALLERETLNRVEIEVLLRGESLPPLIPAI
jgi:ATP-dependent metalloprotease